MKRKLDETLNDGKKFVDETVNDAEKKQCIQCPISLEPIDDDHMITIEVTPNNPQSYDVSFLWGSIKADTQIRDPLTRIALNDSIVNQVISKLDEIGEPSACSVERIRTRARLIKNSQSLKDLINYERRVELLTEVDDFLGTKMDTILCGTEEEAQQTTQDFQQLEARMLRRIEEERNRISLRIFIVETLTARTSYFWVLQFAIFEE